MKELVAQIKEQIAAFTENADLQVEKNNKAAGTRARKSALELSKLMKEAAPLFCIRVESSEEDHGESDIGFWKAAFTRSPDSSGCAACRHGRWT